jgi:hypothetical protein
VEFLKASKSESVYGISKANRAIESTLKVFLLGTPYLMVIQQFQLDDVPLKPCTAAASYTINMQPLLKSISTVNAVRCVTPLEIVSLDVALPGCSLLTAELQNIVTGWIPGKSNWQLAWKGSRDGFEAQDFHRLCDRKGASLTIIKCQGGNLFGGYSPVSWDTPQLRKGTKKPAPGCFIFTLTNPHGIPPTRYYGQEHSGVFFHSSCGPVFGSNDLRIEDSCDKHSCNKFEFPNKFVDTTGSGDATFTGSNHFAVSEIELFVSPTRR